MKCVKGGCARRGPCFPFFVVRPAVAAPLLGERGARAPPPARAPPRARPFPNLKPQIQSPPPQRFQQFPPGHYYSSKTGEFTRYYNPQFYLDFEVRVYLRVHCVCVFSVCRWKSDRGRRARAPHHTHPLPSPRPPNPARTRLTPRPRAPPQASPPVTPAAPYDAAVLRAAFEAAVEKRMMSDVPFGARGA